MDILSVSLNAPLRVYYKANNLESGLNVVFNIWDANGALLQSNVSADGEIGSRGVYFLDITTPSYDTYLLVKVSTNSDNGTIATVYRVGIPPVQKLFYVDGGFKTSKVHEYRIFDFSASTEQSGILDEVAGGFYSTDVLVQNNLDLFFKVGTFVKEFDLLDSTVVFVSGGVIVGGTALFAQEIATSGGIVIGGVADTISFLPASGGVVVDGTAEVVSFFSPQGGVFVGGSAVTQSFIVSQGGVIVGGSAATEEFVSTEGGVVVGGTTANVHFIPNPKRTQTSCYFIGDIVYLKYPVSGILPARYEQHYIQGVRFFGNRYLYDLGLGVLIDGSLLLSVSEFIADQAREIDRVYGLSQERISQLDNAPIQSDPAGGSIKIEEQLSKDPINIDFTDKLNRLRSVTPSNDPVGGSLKKSETEGLPSEDRYSELLSRLNKLKDISVDPEPQGGSVKITKTISEPRVNDIAAKVAKKLERLRNHPISPAPSGGSITLSETDGIKKVDISSAQRNLEDLQNVALLPDPAGAYILVSMETEGGNQKFADLHVSIKNKLDRLLGI